MIPNLPTGNNAASSTTKSAPNRNALTSADKAASGKTSAQASTAFGLTLAKRMEDTSISTPQTTADAKQISSSPTGTVKANQIDTGTTLNAPTPDFTAITLSSMIYASQGNPSAPAPGKNNSSNNEVSEAAIQNSANTGNATYGEVISSGIATTNTGTKNSDLAQSETANSVMANTAPPNPEIANSITDHPIANNSANLSAETTDSTNTVASDSITTNAHVADTGTSKKATGTSHVKQHRISPNSANGTTVSNTTSDNTATVGISSTNSSTLNLELSKLVTQTTSSASPNSTITKGTGSTTSIPDNLKAQHNIHNETSAPQIANTADTGVEKPASPNIQTKNLDHTYKNFTTPLKSNHKPENIHTENATHRVANSANGDINLSMTENSGAADVRATIPDAITNQRADIHSAVNNTTGNTKPQMAGDVTISTRPPETAITNTESTSKAAITSTTVENTDISNPLANNNNTADVRAEKSRATISSSVNTDNGNIVTDNADTESSALPSGNLANSLTDSGNTGNIRTEGNNSQVANADNIGKEEPVAANTAPPIARAITGKENSGSANNITESPLTGSNTATVRTDSTAARNSVPANDTPENTLTASTSKGSIPTEDATVTNDPSSNPLVENTIATASIRDSAPTTRASDETIAEEKAPRSTNTGRTQNTQTGQRTTNAASGRIETTNTNTASNFTEKLDQSIADNADTIKAADLTGNKPTAAPTAPSGIGTPAAMQPGTQAANAPQNQAAISTPLNSHQWPEELSQKIIWVSSQKNHTAELHLNPPELGPMRVTLSITDNQATAQFTSPHSAVREAIENALPKLRESLAENGIMLGDASVNDQAPRDNTPSNFMNQRNEARAQTLGTSFSSEPEVNSLPPVPERKQVGLVDTYA